MPIVLFQHTFHPTVQGSEDPKPRSGMQKLTDFRFFLHPVASEQEENIATQCDYGMKWACCADGHDDIVNPRVGPINSTVRMWRGHWQLWHMHEELNGQ